MAYIYHNSNPNGYRIPDCVVRAICTATGIPYFNVISMLHLNGEIFGCDDLNVKCYEKMLDQDLKLPHHLGNGKTVKQVAEDFKDRKLLLRIEGHLSTSEYGDVLDLWDCSDEIVTDFWIV